MPSRCSTECARSDDPPQRGFLRSGHVRTGDDSMRISRRDLLLTSGVFLLGGARAIGQGVARPRTQDQARSPQESLLEALQRDRRPLAMSGGVPVGRGWEWLVKEAWDARFTLIGEEHGVVEIAQLSAALFKALRSSGYSRMAIELSPIIAQDIEAAAR